MDTQKFQHDHQLAGVASDIWLRGHYTCFIDRTSSHTDQDQVQVQQKFVPCCVGNMWDWTSYLRIYTCSIDCTSCQMDRVPRKWLSLVVWVTRETRTSIDQRSRWAQPCTPRSPEYPISFWPQVRHYYQDKSLKNFTEDGGSDFFFCNNGASDKVPITPEGGPRVQLAILARGLSKRKLRPQYSSERNKR